MNNSFQNLLREATRLTQIGRLKEATQAIQRALSGNSAAASATRNVHAEASSKGAPISSPSSFPTASPLILDGCVSEVLESPNRTVPPVAAKASMGQSPHEARPWALPGQPHTQFPDDVDHGSFTNGTHDYASLKRRYKLYVPPQHSGGKLPLVVMLHGCTQDPDDFAAGTNMNERARAQGFYVLYPAQSQEANPSRCWNWFKHNHQRRDSGEPGLLASLTQAIIQQHDIDPHHVYIAGLSAGGAMAAIVAAAYPDIFAAVGVHSGLPCGAATNMPEALAMMKSGKASQGIGIKPILADKVSQATAHQQKPIPTIVFHGDQDQTVHPLNGDQVIAAVLASVAAGADDSASIKCNSRVEQGVSAQGMRYTRSSHHNKGAVIAEHWLVHGAGHAWSGGQAEGSYTNTKGPDATGEMLRFFFEHPHGLQ